jgi:CRP/FNR family transcriptional regulator, anaerobic regulatory protein
LADATTVRVLAQQYVFRAGDFCEALLIFLSGTARVQLVSSKGRRVTLYRIVPGSSCLVTALCLLNNSCYPAEAIAESEVEAVAVSPQNLYTAIDLSPRFRQHVFVALSSSVTDVIEKTGQLAFTSVDARLSNALLDLHANGESRVTHEALAIELGTAREVVSRRLKSFESEGWVRLQRGRVIVSDQSGLQSAAESARLPNSFEGH